jgi:DNA-directed RNA polymerase subunit RPC12/RpoP
MSKIGKIAKCSGCGEEKPIFSELDDSHEKIKCERCGQLLLHQELADHLLEYHSEI